MDVILWVMGIIAAIFIGIPLAFIAILVAIDFLLGICLILLRIVAKLADITKGICFRFKDL